MNHRHLLPDEVDLLLDGEEGFGVAPLRSHVETCAQCRTELESQRQLVVALERLPHFAASPLFAERVMAQVQVFEPWHVTLRDTMRRFLPRTQASRAVVAATGGLMALTVTLLTFWIAKRVDAALFVANLAVERTREGLLGMLHTALVSTVGESAATAVRANGPIGLLIAATGAAVAVLGVAYGLRSLTAVARRRRV